MVVESMQQTSPYRISYKNGAVSENRIHIACFRDRCINHYATTAYSLGCLTSTDLVPTLSQRVMLPLHHRHQ